MTVGDAPLSVTVEIPTFQELLNISNLVEQLQPVREEHQLDLMDDDDSRHAGVN